ncbi:MAG: GlsB/YeaQ/YmgE family stress response membrane protein [Propionicimonas sp.]|jgi:uncharacterized membrane protein YeaQ/YmgE (transglycosylase-associated protein family)
MNILGWILMGLIAGTIAKSLMKKDGGSWVSTLVTGIVGAIVGGWIGAALFNNGDLYFFSLWSWLLAIGGSALVIWIYSLITRKS